MLQKEMIEAGEQMASDLMDAQMSQCMGTMGGHIIKNISEYSNSDLIQKCLDNEMVSVEATYKNTSGKTHGFSRGMKARNSLTIDLQ